MAIKKFRIVKVTKSSRNQTTEPDKPSSGGWCSEVRSREGGEVEARSNLLLLQVFFFLSVCLCLKTNYPVTKDTYFFIFILSFMSFNKKTDTKQHSYH